jgi:cytidine kinase
LLQLLREIDGLVLNDSESQLITGDSNLVRAAERILELGPKFVVIKKGEHGSLLMHEQGCVVLPAYPARDVIDPTGAGDSFAGGMMGCLSAGGDVSLAGMRKAMACGTVIASFNIESFSLHRLQQLTPSDVQQRLVAYQRMLSIE